MTIFPLLVGILLAAFIFAAFLWACFQSLSASGRLRWAQAATAASILLGFVALSNLWVSAQLPLGVLIIVSSTTAVWLEKGWSRLLPGFATLFGVVLVLGLPIATP